LAQAIAHITLYMATPGLEVLRRWFAVAGQALPLTPRRGSRTIEV